MKSCQGAGSFLGNSISSWISFIWKCLLILSIMLFLNGHRYGMGSLAFLIVFAFPGVSINLINYNLNSFNWVLIWFELHLIERLALRGWIICSQPAGPKTNHPQNIFFRLQFTVRWLQLISDFDYHHPNADNSWPVISVLTNICILPFSLVCIPLMSLVRDLLLPEVTTP